MGATAQDRYGSAGGKARLRVQSVAQETDYTCGPASLRAVLSYWGVGASEKEIAEKAHTTPSAGTSHSGMVAAARAYGMYGDSMYGSGITDLEMRIDRGMPVIVNFIPEEGGGAQAGPEPRYGHYSVVIGYDRDSLFMMDVDGGRERSMGKGAFESLWFSEMYGRRWMLVLYPWQHPGRKKVKPGRAG